MCTESGLHRQLANIQVSWCAVISKKLREEKLNNSEWSIGFFFVLLQVENILHIWRSHYCRWRLQNFRLSLNAQCLRALSRKGFYGGMPSVMLYDIWLKYRRYGVKHYPINRSICDIGRLRFCGLIYLIVYMTS